ncbi:MAG: hypothetical protein GY745_22175, partial [Actinomycetia bacterium]|nr:hypothetical protein [Actinomycetes bacterium]
DAPKFCALKDPGRLEALGCAGGGRVPGLAHPPMVLARAAAVPVPATAAAVACARP